MKKRKKRTAAPTGASFIRGGHGAGRDQTRTAIVEGKAAKVVVKDAARVEAIPPDELTQMPENVPVAAGAPAGEPAGDLPVAPRDGGKFAKGEAMSEFSAAARKVRTDKERAIQADGEKLIAKYEAMGKEPLDESSKGLLRAAVQFTALASKQMSEGNATEARKNNAEARANIAIVSELVARSARARNVDLPEDGAPEIPPIEYFDLAGNVVPHDEVLVFPPNCEPTQFGKSVGLSMMFRPRQDATEGSPDVAPAVPHLLFGKAPAMPAPAFDAEDLERRLQEDRERQEANEARYRIEKAAMAAAKRREAEEDEKATPLRDDPLDPTKKRRQR